MKKLSVILVFVFAFVMVSSPAFAATGRGDSSGGDRDGDGYISNKYGGDDCNDRKASIHPGAQEICEDGIDQDCSGADLECPESGSPVIDSLSDYSLDNGQTVIINGSGFGAKDPVEPVLWEHFNDGVNLQTIDGWRGWNNMCDNPDPLDCPRFSNDNLRTSGLNLRTYSLLSDQLEGEGALDETVLGNLDLDRDGRYFISLWTRIDSAPVVQGTEVKYFRIYSDNGTARGGYPALMFEEENGASSNWDRWSIKGLNEGCGGGTNTYSGHMIYDEWFLLKFQNDLGTPGVANGKLKIWHRNVVIDRDNVAFRHQNCVEHVNTDAIHSKILLGSYIKPTSCDLPFCDIEIFWDDLYADNTWQRIEVCEGQDYEAASHCEVQIPHTIWNDNHIQFTANQGSFQPGQTVWLYVINGDGVPSAGYPVTIGY